MLRITQVSEDSDQVCLKMEGRVTGDWVSELDRVCGSCLSQSRHITLDMSDVTYIDRQGVDTLKRIMGENVRLTGATSAGLPDQVACTGILSEKVRLTGATLLVQALLGRQLLGKIRREIPR